MKEHILSLLPVLSFVVIYLIAETIVSNSLRNIALVSKEEDKGSLQAIKQAIFFGHIIAFTVAFVPFTMLTGMWYFYLGIAIICIGLTIRVLSIASLRKRFTYRVSILQNHPIETSGIYSNIRHPGYLGQLMVFLGISVSMGNWLSIPVLMFILIPFYIRRIRIEEAVLMEYKKDDYEPYTQKTKRLIPFIY